MTFINSMEAFLKKHRWTFEARDNSGNITFPESFIKFEGVPGGFKPVGAIDFTQYFVGYDRLGQAEEEFAKYENYRDSDIAYLRCYDGIGRKIEEWFFRVNWMHLIKSDGDEFVVDWMFGYEDYLYLNQAIPIEIVESTTRRVVSDLDSEVYEKFLNKCKRKNCSEAGIISLLIKRWVSYDEDSVERALKNNDK